MLIDWTGEGSVFLRLFPCSPIETQYSFAERKWRKCLCLCVCVLVKAHVSANLFSLKDSRNMPFIFTAHLVQSHLSPSSQPWSENDAAHLFLRFLHFFHIHSGRNIYLWVSVAKWMSTVVKTPETLSRRGKFFCVWLCALLIKSEFSRNFSILSWYFSFWLS